MAVWRLHNVTLSDWCPKNLNYVGEAISLFLLANWPSLLKTVSNQFHVYGSVCKFLTLPKREAEEFRIILSQNGRYESDENMG